MPYTGRVIASAPSSDERAEQFLGPAGRARAQKAIAELHEWLGTRLSTAEAARAQHGRGEAYGRVLPPDAVVWPESTEEVSRIVATCSRHQTPVIAFGAGTSLEGHVSAPYGGICIDCSRMSEVLSVNPADMDCVVQPGVTREQLNSYLRDTGLFFPVDPGANATLGGMVSTRASGTTTIRYGAMTRNVLALQVVLADGRIVRIGTRAAKSSTGYDLVRLLVGAEGTLGVITEIALRLYGIPETTVGATCVFPELRGAVDAVVEIIQSGASVSRIEFLDEVQVRACNSHSRAADAVPGIQRYVRERRRSGHARGRDCAIERRRGFPMGDGRRGARAIVEGAALRLFRRAGIATRLRMSRRGRLRADFAACRCGRRRTARDRRGAVAGADRWPRR